MTEIMKDFARRLMFRHRFRAFLPGRVPRGCLLEIDLVRLFEIQHRQLRVIFDVGANVGQTAKQFSRFFPVASIHSFEPVAGTFDALRTNVQRLKNVTPHKLAIGAKEGKVRMEILPQSEWNRVVRDDSRDGWIV